MEVQRVEGQAKKREIIIGQKIDDAVKSWQL
jgi:hypothetical protein